MQFVQVGKLVTINLVNNHPNNVIYSITDIIPYKVLRARMMFAKNIPN